MKLPAMLKNKYLVMASALIFAVVPAMLGGYLNELGVRLFPQYEKYVDNVVAIIIVVPMIYLVFVPFFRAASSGKKAAPQENGDC